MDFKGEKSIFRNIFWAIFLVAFASSLAFQGSRGLFDRDETRYAECAREMLVENSLLVPLRQFEPHLTKPPLTYWAIGASMKFIGINEWGVRFPNAICFSITVVVVGLIAARLLGKHYGPWASLIYLTGIFPYAASNIVTTDTILVMWEVLGVWAFLSGYFAASKRIATGWFALMALFWGLGFLTKGPAVLPVGAGIFIFWWIRRHEFKACPFGIIPTIIFVSTWLWWYAAISLKYPWAFDLIIREQITGRLFSNEFHRNSAWYAPFYIYFPALLMGLFPWNIQWLKRASLKDWSQSSTYGTAQLLLFSWFFVPLVVFLVAKSRLPLYILPLFPPMAVFTANIVAKGKRRENPLLDPGVLYTLIALISIKFMTTLIHPPQDARAMYEKFSRHISRVNEIDVLRGTNVDGLLFYSGKKVEFLPGPSDHSVLNMQQALSPWYEEGLELSRGPEVFFLDLKRKEYIDYLISKGIVLEPLEHYHRFGLFRVYGKNCKSCVKQTACKRLKSS